MDRVDKDVVLPLQWTLVYSDALEAQVRDPHWAGGQPDPADVLRVQVTTIATAVPVPGPWCRRPRAYAPCCINPHAPSCCQSAFGGSAR
jgi:hypothetical protein